MIDILLAGRYYDPAGDPNPNNEIKGAPKKTGNPLSMFYSDGSNLHDRLSKFRKAARGLRGRPPLDKHHYQRVGKLLTSLEGPVTTRRLGRTRCPALRTVPCFWGSYLLVCQKYWWLVPFEWSQDRVWDIVNFCVSLFNFFFWRAVTGSWTIRMAGFCTSGEDLDRVKPDDPSGSELDGRGPPATYSHFYAVLVTSSLRVKPRRVCVMFH